MIFRAKKSPALRPGMKYCSKFYFLIILQVVWNSTAE